MMRARLAVALFAVRYIWHGLREEWRGWRLQRRAERACARDGHVPALDRRGDWLGNPHCDRCGLQRKGWAGWQE